MRSYSPGTCLICSERNGCEYFQKVEPVFDLRSQVMLLLHRWNHARRQDTSRSAALYLFIVYCMYYMVTDMHCCSFFL